MSLSMLWTASAKPIDINLQNEGKQEELKMAQVGIVMGSDSDMPVMAKAADILDKLGIEL